MRLWHGSKYRFSSFRTPAEGYPIQPSEAGRNEFRDVVFLTSDRAQAVRYAEREGYLYEVEVAKSVPYRQAVVAAGKKWTDVGEGIHIAFPTECRIMSVLHKLPRRRNAEQKWTDLTGQSNG